jgi:adhesin transport system outer membrane protein
MRMKRVFPAVVFVLSAALLQVFALAQHGSDANAQSSMRPKKQKSFFKKVSLAVGAETSDEDDPQDEGSALIFKIGEEQITYLREFLKSTGRDWSMDELQRFRGAINAAVEDHPEVLAAKSASRSAGYSVREAWASKFPQVNGQSQRGPVKSDPSSVLSTPGRNYTSASVGVVIRQLLFDFGATSNVIDANSARDELAQYKAKFTRSDVALRAVQAHHELLRARRQLELAHRNLQSRESILDLVSQRQELGGGTMSDVVRARSRVADAAASEVSAKQRLGIVESSYREIFGPHKEMDDDMAQVLVDIPLDKSLLDDINREAPESYKVRMAIASRNAAEYDYKSMVSKGLPSISVEASSTRRDLAGPGEPGYDKSVYLVLRHNFYTGGADTAREDQYREKMLQSDEDLRAAKREAERLFAQAMQEASSIESLIKSRLKAVELSADSLRMVREQFAYRRGSLLDLLTAQETLNSAGRDLIDAQIDSAQAKYKVLYSASLLNKFFSLE